MRFIAALIASLIVVQTAPSPDQKTIARNALVAFAETAALRAVNFAAGDGAALQRSRADFTADGWKLFMKHMEGFTDAQGAPTFTSTFTVTGRTTIVSEADGIVRLRIPGTLKQTQNTSSTTYRAALEVAAGGTPPKLHEVKQITCLGASRGCN